VKPSDYKKGLIVKLAKPVRVRCCEASPIPEGAQIVLFDQLTQNRANVGLYFEPEAPLHGPNPAVHHRAWPIGEMPVKKSPPGGFTAATGKAKDIFPNGGFCLHKVKISGIQGEVLGSVNPEIFNRSKQAEGGQIWTDSGP